MRSLQRVQDNLTDTLAMITKFRQQSEKAVAAPKQPVKQANPLDRQGKDPRREQILDALASEEYSITAIALQFNTSQRSIRRVLDRAKAEGDPRVANRAKKLVPADSSQDESRSLRKHASDPLAGTNGKPEPAAEPMQQQGGQSEEESTGSRTVEVQAGNELGSTDASSESVPVGRAAETGGESDTSSPEPASFQSLGDIASKIIERRRQQLNEELKQAEAELLETMEQQFPEVEDDLESFSPPVETTLQEPVQIAVALATGPDPHVEQEVVFTPLPKAKVRRVIASPAGIEVDLDEGAVTGTAGTQKVDKLFAKVLNHMKDGGLYPLDVLAQTAGYRSKDLVRDSLKSWKPKLEQIGIGLQSLGKDFDLVKMGRIEV